MRNNPLWTAAGMLVSILFLVLTIGCSQSTPQPEDIFGSTVTAIAAEVSQTGLATAASGTASPSPEVTPDVTLTPAVTSDSGSGVASSMSTSVANRTPVPTPTPGPIDRQINNLVNSLGWTDQTLLGLTTEDWINLFVSILMILIGYLVLDWVVFKLLKRVARQSSIKLGNQILSVIENPLRWLILIFIARFSILRLDFIDAGTRIFFEDVFFIASLGFATLIGVRLIRLAAVWYIGTKKKEKDPERLIPLVIIVQRIGYFFLFIFALSLGLDHFGFNITVLAALLLLGGAVLSLGARETVQNMVNGFLILIDQPFRVGDDILIQDLNTWGNVLEIGTHTTRVRTRDNREVIVPNAKIGQSPVTNYSLPDPSFRVETQIGVAYGSDFEKVQETITKAVQSVDGVLADKSVSIYFSEFGDSARQMKVRWWVASRADKNPVLSRVNQALELALTEAGIVLPNNVMDLNVNLHQEASASQEAPDKKEK